VRLFDEGSGALREVEIRPRMTVYVCGITPYDSAHLGHGFVYTQFDVLVRYLRHLGANVVHVQNVTDVDDDILRVARQRGVDYRELAERETRAFERTMGAINITPPSHSPLASEFVPRIVGEVRALVEAGHGYERDGTVYFRIASWPRYGELSGLAREEMLQLAAERGGHPEDPNKDDPLDFVLWQRSLPDEPPWDSPWGKGRPGWHIECSTMARSLLGQPLDVHGGGKDLIYPHHESERAQALALPGSPEPFVRHWMHAGTVHMSGEKMSKSLGNLAFVADLLERHAPRDIRSFLLRQHYRQDWAFDEAQLEQEPAVRSIRYAPDYFAEQPPMREQFLGALDEDLDTPAALRCLEVARLSHHPDAPAFIAEAESILGLDF
jgi:L-cysteine:1D-myo-inositol 2-amino-2-deoxy-alpha-D-glucopyranoside ligase